VVKSIAAALLVLDLLALPQPARAQDTNGSIRGQVKDPSGAAVPGARVELAGRRRRLVTDEQGTFAAERLRPGAYDVVVTKDGFLPFTNHETRVEAGRVTTLDIALVLAPVRETVTVQESQSPLSLSADSNAGAIVLKGADLDALPDDPDELAEALQALAGPAAGPNGGQIFIDGFTGGRMPPKSAIREIRLNANPFSAEYDRLGYGRIEIFTKPGSETLRGQTSFNFNNQALNSRDPFDPDRPAYQRTTFEGNISGPIVAKKSSFFVDFSRRAVDDTSIVNATVLDADLRIVPLHETVITPQWRTTVSPRLDFQLGPSNTLTLRYTYTSVEQDDTGIGGFTLASRGYDRTNHEHSVQLSETAALGKVVNETRFRWLGERADQSPRSTSPTLQVLEAFTDGGALGGVSSNHQDRIELQNVTSWTYGSHSFRAGLRLRTVHEQDVSRQNFAGTVTFSGGLSPELDALSHPVLGPDGLPVLVSLTSIERYQRTVALQQLGLPGSAIRLLGGGASQLQIAGGEPLANVSQWDLGPFIQDDWKVRPDLLVGLGLRYEVQDNIRSRLDLAPRLSFAWSPGAGGRTPKTVVRGGLGVFYERVGENLTLDALRSGGTLRQNFLVTDPDALDTLSFTDGGVTGIPSVENLLAFARPQVTRQLAADLKAPRTLQTSLSVERALPGNFTLTGTWILARTDRALRSRVTWAPSFPDPAPAGATGPVYEYESTGRVHQDQWILGLNNRLNPKLSLFFRYFLARARSDSDGASSFPADSSDPAADWARASIDVRHRIILGGRIEGPWGLRASPLVQFATGRPFNITTGRDGNRDTVFTDRPASATDPSAPEVVVTPWGAFDPAPLPGQALIARNLGRAPGFFSVNLRLSRTFSFGHRGAGTATPPDDGGRPGGRGGFGGGGGGRGGGFGGGRGGGRDASGGEGGRGLTLSLSATNLFNHVNLAAPVGNLSSPSFGESLATAGGFGFGRGAGGGAGNRRIELQARIGL
jgi:hypothetical protein